MGVELFYRELTDDPRCLIISTNQMKLACSASDNFFFSIFLFSCNNCIILHTTGLDKIILYLFLRTERKAHIPMPGSRGSGMGLAIACVRVILSFGRLAGIRPISKASHNAFLPEVDSEGQTLLDGHCLWKRNSSNSTHNLNIKTKN